MKYLIPANILLLPLTLVLIAILLIAGPANATNTPKPKDVNINAQQQGQGQAQGQHQESVNLNSIINAVKNDIRNDVVTSANSKSILMQGDTSAYSGGNNFFAPPQVNFISVPADTCGFSVTYTNDGGPYDAGKGGSLGCNASWGVGRDLKKAEASLLKAQESIIARDQAREDKKLDYEIAIGWIKDAREAQQHEMNIRTGCAKLHVFGHVKKDSICETVSFTDVHHTPEVEEAAGLMRDPGHKD